jgi:hypothetical protein
MKKKPIKKIKRVGEGKKSGKSRLFKNAQTRQNIKNPP